MSMLVLIIIQNIIFSIYTAYHLYLSFFTKYKKSAVISLIILICNSFIITRSIEKLSDYQIHDFFIFFLPIIHLHGTGVRLSPTYFFFLPHLGVIPIKNSKLIPGIGRDNTERYSSSKRLLTVPFKDKSAQRSENPFSRVTLLMR